MSASPLRFALVIGLLMGTLALAAVPAQAATVTACPANGSELQSAITAAGAGSTVLFGCDTTIVLASTIALSNVSLDGPGYNVTISGNNAVRILTVSGTVTLTGLTLINGNVGSYNNGSPSYGGAILAGTGSALTISGSTFSGNTAYFGGAISHQGVLTVTGSSFTGGNATYGGAIGELNGATATITNSTLSGNTAIAGGAIYGQSATLNLNSSTLSGNSAYSGGAIDIRVSTTTITNSTLSGNGGNYGNAGGAIFVAAGTLVVTNSTIAGNRGFVGGGFYSTDAAVTVTNSILASVSGSNCYLSTSSTAGSFTNGGGNLSTDASCTGVPTVTASALNLGPLADNGGSTQTQALLSGSVAIEAGVSSVCNAAPVNGLDQRRFRRPAMVCDSGAYDTGGVPADTTAPVISYTLDPVAPTGDNGWYTDDVSLTWQVVEDESPDSLVKTGCANQAITIDQMATTYSCAATSDGGSATQVDVTIQRDATAPVVEVTGIANGAVYTLGDVIPTASCDTTDATSGVAANATLSSSGGPVGEITATCDGAMDNAGNAGSASLTYTVVYAWSDFAGPIDSQTLNAVKAGAGVPVTFSLAGDQGLAAITGITSVAIACESGAVSTEITDTVAAGNSSLQYDALTDEYTYVWKTDKSWSGTCRQLTLTLADGTSHQASFQFR